MIRMQRHDWSSTSPKEPMLHLSLCPCTGYQLQLASSSRHWCLHIEQPQAQHPPTSTHYYESTSPPEAPSYFHSLLRIYIASRSLRSASERRLVVPSQRGSKSLSRTFSFTVPDCWNNLSPPPPPPHPDRWIPVNLQATTENSSLSTLLDYLKKKKSLSFSPSLVSLCLFEQCLRLGVIATSSVCLPLQDESLYVFPNCKSLWIKASAKWLNVNVNE